MAVQAKADMNAVQQSKEYGIEIEAGNEPYVDEILANLDKYQKILEEPEQ